MNQRKYMEDSQVNKRPGLNHTLILVTDVELVALTPTDRGISENISQG